MDDRTDGETNEKRETKKNSLFWRKEQKTFFALLVLELRATKIVYFATRAGTSWCP